MKANELQNALFKTLREDRRQGTGSLVKELSGIIYKSRPTIYKKLQGNISLTVDEMVTICDHYQIDIDSLLHEKPAYSSLVLEDPVSADTHNTCRMLLDQIHQWNNTAHTSVIVDVSDVFAFAFQFPVLAAFIMHFNTGGVEAPFSYDSAASDSDLLRVADRITVEYRGVNKIEFWRPYVFDHILLQIMYYDENSLFDRRTDAAHLIGDVGRAVRELQRRSKSMLEKCHSRSRYCFVNSGRASNTIAVHTGDSYSMYRGQWNQGWTMTCNSRFSRSTFDKLYAYYAKLEGKKVDDSVDKQFFDNLENRILQAKQTLHSRYRA